MPSRGLQGGDDQGSNPRSARSRRSRKIAARRKVFLPGYEPMEKRELLATMVWTNPAGGDWDTAANWVNLADSNDQHVPMASDDAEINLSGITITHASGTSDLVNSLTVASGSPLSLSSGTLSIASASTVSGDLTMAGGTLTGAGTLTVNGAMTWTGGTMSGTGATIAEGGLAIGDPNTPEQMFLDQRTLDNQGAATLADYYSSWGLYLSSGAVFDNQAGATFAFTSDASVVDNGGTPDGGTFDNEGTLSKTGGAGTSTIDGVTLDDTGSVEASSGTLSLRGGGSLAGTIGVAAALSFDAGAYTLADGLAGTGAGTVYLTGATVSVAGAASLANFWQFGGTLTGPGTLTVSGQAIWTGGYESGAGTTVAEGGLTIGDPSTPEQMFLDQRTLDNRVRRHAGRLLRLLGRLDVLRRHHRQRGRRQLRVHLRRLAHRQRRHARRRHVRQRGEPHQDGRHRDQHHRQRDHTRRHGDDRGRLRDAEPTGRRDDRGDGRPDGRRGRRPGLRRWRVHGRSRVVDNWDGYRDSQRERRR